MPESTNLAFRKTEPFVIQKQATEMNAQIFKLSDFYCEIVLILGCQHETPSGADIMSQFFFYPLIISFDSSSK